MDPDTKINYKHFFRQLVEALPWPMLIVTTNLHILYHNQPAQTLLNLDMLQKKQPLEQVLSNPAIIKFAQDSIQGHCARSGEFEQAGQSGAWKVSVRPIEHRELAQNTKNKHNKANQAAPQNYQYFAVVIEDLTELRRLERVRSDFVANISHELRTPLASVRLLAETLEDTIETDPEKSQVFIERIENEVQYLSDLVAELLELSRIEAGRVPMNIEPIESAMLVREVMARLLPQAQKQRVILRTQIEQGHSMVAADSKQIARVLVNLVHNAIKFTPSGGTITIGTRQQLDTMGQDFFVRDTGVGISPEDLPRVFERFYKVSPSRSRDNFIGPGGAGSGLGLAIARHVIEAHGGRITAASEPNKGSVFTFTLPISIPMQKNSEK